MDPGLTSAARGKRIKKKSEMNFLIYTLGRTGSTLLTNLINHLPGVECDKEILRTMPSNPYSIIADKVEKCEKGAFGFKVKTSHLHSPPEFLHRMQMDGWKFVYLDRSDVVATSISYLYARDSGSFFYNNRRLKFLNPQRPKIKLDVDEFINKLDENTKLVEYDMNLLSDFSYLKINYELDLESKTSHRNTLNKLSEYLGLDYFSGRLKIATSKSVPSYSKVISNWNDICDKLSNTPYAVYL